MIVTQGNFADTLARLAQAPVIAVDTETTGLKPYHDSEIFSLILHDGAQSYYFNFENYAEISPDENLESPENLESLRLFFAADASRTWVFHNARFDLAILKRAGWRVVGRIHDTMVAARVIDSTLFPNQFSLDACASRIGYPKDDAVKTWLLKNKAFTEEKLTGKKTKKKNLHFNHAPWDLIVPYGCRDAEITYKLAQWQLKELAIIDQQLVSARIDAKVSTVHENECELVRTVYEMEAVGVKLDSDFCHRAIAQLSADIVYLEGAFLNITGEHYSESTLTFQRVFASEEWTYGELTSTGKKNPSFDSDALASFKSPAAALVLKHRKAKSDIDYFHGFLYAADADGVIHTSFNQHATATGRFSSSNPNLQNLTKDDEAALEKDFVVRRAIIPRPGMVFHMLDYQAMEYRLMLDYAARAAFDEEGVLVLISKVLSGLDVHQATADVAGVSRRDAKTTNFATLYGSGITNLAGRLGVSDARAREIRESIFRAAPEIRTFIRRATETAEKRGYVVNWFGRRCSFPDARFAYRAPNYLIQGGCADVVKVAMNRIGEYLKDHQTRLVLMIHDELILEGPPEEAATIVPKVREIMETVFPSKFLSLTVGVDHSTKSLADKTEGIYDARSL